VTGQQGMLTLPRHLIPPPVYPGVRVSLFVYLTCNSYLYFETDYSSASWPFHLEVESNKTTEKTHLKHVVDVLVNTLFSLPCKGL
jgi:hypothetical protein